MKEIILLFKIYFLLNLVSVTKNMLSNIAATNTKKTRWNNQHNYLLFGLCFSIISVIIFVLIEGKVNWINYPLFTCLSLILILTYYFLRGILGKGRDLKITNLKSLPVIVSRKEDLKTSNNNTIITITIITN